MMQTQSMQENPLVHMVYEKYLKCPKCKEIEYYCQKHKIEVEERLGILNF